MVSRLQVTLMSLWKWEELEKRYYASSLAKDQALREQFETYLRHSKDDNDLRLYYQDLIRDAETRARGGDPFHHPGVKDGIHLGCLQLDTEMRTGVPYRVELRRTGSLLNKPSTTMVVAGPVGSGKTNPLSYIVLQAAVLCRVIVFARNASFRKRLPVPIRDAFKVVQLEELKLCPTRPTYLPENASLRTLLEETQKVAHWLCKSFGTRYSRHDSLLLLHGAIDLLLRQMNTYQTRQWPGFNDILKIVASRAYRPFMGGKSQHEESLTLTLKEFGFNGLGVLDSRNGVNVQALFDSANLVIETGSYTPEDAAFVIELLLGQLWLQQQYTKTSTPELRYLIALDDLQDAMKTGGVVHNLIRISRHAGFSFLLAPQNIGALSNDVLGNTQTFVLVGPQTNQRDLTQSMATMGLSFKDPMTAEVQGGEVGRAIARQPTAIYGKPTFIRIPHIPETEYSEAERQQRLGNWLEQHLAKEQQSGLPAVAPANTEEQATGRPAPADNHTAKGEKKQYEEIERVKKFVTSANELWFEGHEVHFKAAGVKGGTEKESLLRRARAEGYLDKDDARVAGVNGKPIRLAIVTDFAREQLKLTAPASYKQTRGKQSTRYYQHHLARLLKGTPGIKSVELEGLLGPNLKRVDVLGRLENGKAVCVEFASTVNAEHEIENARILDEAAEQIAKYVIVAETGRVRDKLRKQLTDSRVTIISFYDAIKNKNLLARPESLKNTPTSNA